MRSGSDWRSCISCAGVSGAGADAEPLHPGDRQAGQTERRNGSSTLVESNDGVHIAEIDMKLRGPGEFFGTKQSGVPSLRVANIIRDGEILEVARAEAMSFVDRPPSPEMLREAVNYVDALAAPIRISAGRLICG